jgi:hypothetical protein
MLTSTDGITWTSTYLFRQTAEAQALSLGVYSANSKSFLFPSGGTGVIDCAADLVQAAPDWVGGLPKTFNTDVPAFMRIA